MEMSGKEIQENLIEIRKDLEASTDKTAVNATLKRIIDELYNVVNLMNNQTSSDSNIEDTDDFINNNPYYDIRNFIVKSQVTDEIDTKSSVLIAYLFRYIWDNAIIDTDGIKKIPFDFGYSVLNPKGKYYTQNQINYGLNQLVQKNLLLADGSQQCYHVFTNKNITPLTRSKNNGNETINLRHLSLIHIDTICQIPVIYRELIGNLLDPTMTKTDKLPLFYTTKSDWYTADNIVDAISKTVTDNYIISSFKKYWLKKENNIIFTYDPATYRYSINFKLLYKM